jgi:hypothetical protein
MVARDEGRILFTSSVASTMPGSYQALSATSSSRPPTGANIEPRPLRLTGPIPHPVDGG